MTKEDYKILSRHARIVNQEIHKVSKKIDKLTNAEVSDVTYSSGWTPLDWPTQPPIGQCPSPIPEVAKPNKWMCRFRLGVNWSFISAVVLISPIIGAIGALPVLVYYFYGAFKENEFQDELKDGTEWLGF